MRMKSDMTPLHDTDLLPSDSRSELARYSITTVEELVGAITSDPGAIQHLLSMDDKSFQSLHERAEELLDVETATRLSQRPQGRATGALPPAKYS
jgi:hypothetical protein